MNDENGSTTVVFYQYQGGNPTEWFTTTGLIDTNDRRYLIDVEVDGYTPQPGPHEVDIALPDVSLPRSTFSYDIWTAGRFCLVAGNIPDDITKSTSTKNDDQETDNRECFDVTIPDWGIDAVEGVLNAGPDASVLRLVVNGVSSESPLNRANNGGTPLLRVCRSGGGFVGDFFVQCIDADGNATLSTVC